MVLVSKKQHVYIFIQIFITVFIYIVTLQDTVYAIEPSLSSLFLSLPVQTETAEEWYGRGKLLYEIRAYKEANRAFKKAQDMLVQKKAIKDNNEFLNKLIYLRADCLMKEREYEKAINVINHITSEDVFYPFNLYIKAMVNLETGHMDRAIRYLESLSAYYPAKGKASHSKIIENLSLNAHLRLGYIYLDEGDPGKASLHFSVIPEGKKELYMKALFGAGWAYAKMERWIRSVIFWEEMAERFPYSRYTREVLPYIGLAYKKLSAYGKALEQNTLSMDYYKNFIERINEIQGGIKNRRLDSLYDGLKLLDEEDLLTKLKIYIALHEIEEYIHEHNINDHDQQILLRLIKKHREKIINTLFNEVDRKIQKVKGDIIHQSIDTVLDIADNLRLEGGGHIHQDMVFQLP